ncbi:MAG: hypothetical protein DRO15_00320 [Thermoprotei archaeon]|nr:MAG: hypothetical protein DRO15_00320 [Thermoprotei archaeon]
MRESKLIDDYEFKYLAFLSYIISIAEFAVADGECSLDETEICDLPEEADEWRYYSKALIKLRNCKYEDIYLPREVEELKEYELGSIDIALMNGGYRCTKLLSLYRRVAKKFTSIARTYLEDKLIQTSFSNVEFFLALLRNGKAIILEGEERTIKIPKLRIWATAHTHPYTCIPSAIDMESAEDILCDQGIVEAIISPLCTLIIFREAPLTDTDILALREATEILRYLSTDLDMNAIHELKRILINTNIRLELV